VCCEKHLLILAYGRNLQIVFNSTEPIVRIKRGGALGESWWIGILEVPQPRSWGFFTVSSSIVVPSGELCNVLQCRDIGLALSASGLAIFHKEAQDLSHISLRRGWRVLLA
jgi:hypothetical protein